MGSSAWSEGLYNCPPWRIAGQRANLVGSGRHLNKWFDGADVEHTRHWSLMRMLCCPFRSPAGRPWLRGKRNGKIAVLVGSGAWSEQKSARDDVLHRVRVPAGGPKLTVGRTIFEMRLDI